MELTLDYYRALPYSRRAEGLQEAGADRYWVAWIEELPGCKTDGATYEEAMANLDVAFDDYIEAMLEFGTKIAVPKKLSETVTVREISTSENILYGPIAEVAETLAPEPERSPSRELQPWDQSEDTTTATSTRNVASQIAEALG